MNTQTQLASQAGNAHSAKLELGQLVATQGIVSLFVEAKVSMFNLIARHANGDWGDLSDEDVAANEQALISGARIVSSYTVPTPNGPAKVWVITEGIGDDGHRAATTILLPEKY